MNEGKAMMSFDLSTYAAEKVGGFVPVVKEGGNVRIALSELAPASSIGSVKNGGALTSAASVNVPNNACSTLSTSEAALTLNVNLADGEIPNFAVEITAGAVITLTVTKTVGSTTTTLNYSSAAGNGLESGKLYQVTCVGNCWTLAEFTAPTP